MSDEIKIGDTVAVVNRTDRHWFRPPAQITVTRIENTGKYDIWLRWNPNRHPLEIHNGHNGIDSWKPSPVVSSWDIEQARISRAFVCTSSLGHIGDPCGLCGFDYRKWMWGEVEDRLNNK